MGDYEHLETQAFATKDGAVLSLASTKSTHGQASAFERCVDSPAHRPEGVQDSVDVIIERQESLEDVGDHVAQLDDDFVATFTLSFDLQLTRFKEV